ncbi:MAG TPA: hypothetical protein VGD91_31815 [Trebonia sp.]
MNEQPLEAATVIRDQPVVDLTRFTAEDLKRISRIEDVALVVVPETLASAYAAIATADVASVIYVPAGGNVRRHTGTLATGGDSIGQADDVLVVIGMLLITSPVVAPVPRQIYVVGSVFAPRGSGPELGSALAGGIGSVTYYPYADGQEIKLHTGNVSLSGAALANRNGQENDILIIAGQATVTGQVTAVGYRQVLAAGQLALPAADRDALEDAVQLTGQVGWYRGTSPRVFSEDTTLGPDFFRLLEEPASLVVFGDLTIDDAVTEDAVRDKVAGITLFGDIIAPAGLIGVLQVRTTDAFGSIRASDGQPGS